MSVFFTVIPIILVFSTYTIGLFYINEGGNFAVEAYKKSKLPGSRFFCFADLFYLADGL